MNQSTLELFVPEYSPQNKHYFAKGAAFVQEEPVSVQNCALWAIIKALDTVTSPITVVTTKISGNSAELYRIVCDLPLSFTVPSLFELTTISDKNIFYIPNDRFLEFEAESPCVQVLNNDWVMNEVRYHQIAAFYRLGVIPSLPQSIFSEKDHFQPICNRFYEMYSVERPLSAALQKIFKNMFFAFSFFGFAFPKKIEEKESLDALIGLYNSPDTNMDSDRFYAFTEMKWIIKNFREQCFNKETAPSDVITASMYNKLMGAIYFVRKTLVKLNMLPSGVDLDEALKGGVRNFQASKNIPIGVCDMFTLRQIWNSAVTSSCSFVTLCRICNIGTAITKPIEFNETIKKVTTLYADPSVEALEKAFNDSISKIKTRNEGPKWLIDETEAAVKRHTDRLDDASETVEKLGERIQNIKTELESISDSNDEASKKFDDASKILTQISEEHISMMDDLSKVRQRIIDLHRGNQFVTVLIGIFVFLIVYRWLFGH